MFVVSYAFVYVSGVFYKISITVFVLQFGFLWKFSSQ